MKKWMAILLVMVMVMVLPMCLVTQAEEAETEIKPFYLINWSPIPNSVSSDNVYHLFSMWTREPKATTTALEVSAGAYGVSISSDVKNMAAAMKKEFDSRPEGTKYMMITTRMDKNVDKYVFLDKGTELLKDYLERLYAEFSAIGGTLEGLVIDMEYNEYSAYNLDKVYQDDPFVYKTIVEDSRYQERIRPMLEERGFQFWEDPNDYKPEIYSINEKAGDSKSRSVWDAVLHELMVWYMNEACSPLFKYYPDANLSNYRSYASKGWMKTLGNRGTYGIGGNLSYVGNTTNENAYFYKPSNVYFKAANTSAPTFNYPVGYNKAFLEATKFNTFMWDVNVFKTMMQSSDTEKMSAWVVEHDYTADVPYSGCNSPYYTETYLHIGMMNPMHFLGYVTERADTYALSLDILGDIMKELTRVAGAADRKYINLPHNWNDSFALTGMYAGGRNIWRITPDTTEGMTLEQFKVEGTKDPTFYINGQTITFPGGKIVETGEIRIVDSCGYWVETPENVTPVITSDNDRYRQNPAFQENYDGYETGMEYTYDNVEFVSSWQVKKGKTATAVIKEESDGNKVLAVTGDYTLKNVRVVENITAGETYAKDQAWEVAVTIPADMAADAEVILLAIYGDKNKPIDGGFKIADGKLYYYNGEDYEAFGKLDVSAGGKYLLKRNMDFHVDGTFTCDYTVYNTNGKAVASVADVSVNKEVEIPVESIGFELSKISGEPVLLDDYKLYASGVATDLELYDAELGLKVEEANQARNKDTAYRLAWMNATAYKEVYSVVAAFYEGDICVDEKVIQRIEMAPNADAIETGIVEVADGQSVYIYLQHESRMFVDPADRGKAIVIAAIIGVFVLADAAVVAVVVTGKKKKTDSAEEITDQSAE